MFKITSFLTLDGDYKAVLTWNTRVVGSGRGDTHDEATDAAYADAEYHGRIPAPQTQEVMYA